MGVDAGWVSERYHTEPSPDLALARAVILRAIEDLGDVGNADPQERKQARMFLFAKDGDWARARQAWCEKADIEPEWLDRRLKQIEVAPKPEPRHKMGRRPGGAEIQQFDARILAWLRGEGHLPWAGSKLGLSRLLRDAGFKTARGAPMTDSTVYCLIARNPEVLAAD